MILKFSEDLEPSSGAVLEIAYKGTINHSMKGFYRSKYKPKVKPVASVPMDGEDHVMVSHMFEIIVTTMASLWQSQKRLQSHTCSERYWLQRCIL